MRKPKSKILMLQAAVLAACVGPSTLLLAQVSAPLSEEMSQACSMAIRAGQDLQRQVERPYLQELSQFREANSRIIHGFLNKLDAQSDPSVIREAAALLSRTTRLGAGASARIREINAMSEAASAAHGVELEPLERARAAGIAAHREAMDQARARRAATSVVVSSLGEPSVVTSDGGVPYFSYTGTPILCQGSSTYFFEGTTLPEARRILNERAAEIDPSVAELQRQLDALSGPGRRIRTQRATLAASMAGARTELTRIECLLGNLAPLGATLAEADTHLAAEVVEHETAITALVGADTDYAKMAERHRSEANTINARLAELADARTSIDEISRVLSPLVNNPVRAVSVDFNAAVASEYGNSCTYTTASEPWRHMVHKVSLRGSHVFVDRRLFTGPAVNCTADVPSATSSLPGISSTEMNGTQIRVCNGLPTTDSGSRAHHPEFRGYRVCSSLDLGNSDRSLTHEVEYLDGSNRVIDVVASQITDSCREFYNHWRDGIESLRGVAPPHVIQPVDDSRTEGGADFPELLRRLDRIDAVLSPESVEAPAAPAAAEGAAEAPTEAPVAAE